MASRRFPAILVVMDRKELSRPRVVTRSQLQRLLAEIETEDPAKLTLVVAPSGRLDGYSVPAEVQTWLDDHAQVVRRSVTGAVIFWSSDRVYLIEPPLPISCSVLLRGWRPEPLTTLLAGRYRLGVILLRLGGYAVGLFENDKLIVSKTGGRFVKGRHRKGGQSQRRFERTREKQIQELFDAACAVARERLGPAVPTLDYLFLGGDRRTLQAFLKRCPFLKGLAAKTVGRILNVPEPRYDILAAVPQEIWKSRVWSFQKAE